MSDHVPDDLIEIHDPAVDPVAIMATIRERVAQRRKEKGYDQRTFPSFGLTETPEAPSDLPYDPDLYYYLRLANETFAHAPTALALAPSPATQVPGVGRVWSLIRREVHNLVLFYVNRAVTHEVNVNRYLVSVLNRLTLLSQAQQRTIESLQEEVRALREGRDGGGTDGA